MDYQIEVLYPQFGSRDEFIGNSRELEAFAATLDEARIKARAFDNEFRGEFYVEILYRGNRLPYEAPEPPEPCDPDDLPF